MNILTKLLGYEKQRQRLLKKAPEGPLRDYLAEPLPDKNCPISQTPLLALDFETTGLNPKVDHILSAGYLDVEDNEIVLGTSHHAIVDTDGALKEENVVIHQITDDHKAQGQSLEETVSDLLKALRGKVMLVHFAHIERSFLNDACLKLYGMAPVYPIIDTFMLAKRRMDMKSAGYDPSELRLSNLRKTANLPHYNAHNALTDALATAELLFVEVAMMSHKQSPPLKNLLL
ncbi:MAG: DNA polymerase III subunit epsilon [Proteobacteria bacterium]|nr:MAG: DNA polymerase III subunit epsilon [Pseudomonadota bacterium]